MPIYEYKCSRCNNAFEELARTKDRDRACCPTCKRADAVERVLSLFAARADQNAPVAAAGGCGRCGDPNGPCQFE